MPVKKANRVLNIPQNKQNKNRKKTYHTKNADM